MPSPKSTEACFSLNIFAYFSEISSEYEFRYSISVFYILLITFNIINVSFYSLISKCWFSCESQNSIVTLSPDSFVMFNSILNRKYTSFTTTTCFSPSKQMKSLRKNILCEECDDVYFGRAQI